MGRRRGQGGNGRHNSPLAYRVHLAPVLKGGTNFQKLAFEKLAGPLVAGRNSPAREKLRRTPPNPDLKHANTDMRATRVALWLVTLGGGAALMVSPPPTPPPSSPPASPPARTIEESGAYLTCVANVPNCVALDLSSSRLTGTIPTEVGGFTALKLLCAPPFASPRPTGRMSRSRARLTRAILRRAAPRDSR